MSKDRKSKVWTIVSGLAAAMPVAMYLIVSQYYQQVSNVRQTRGVVLALLLLSALSIIVSIVACFQLKSWKKLWPVVGIVVLLIIISLAYMMYWFSAYK